VLRVLSIIAIVMLTIYCVVELAQTKGTRVRAMPRWLWLFVVVCVPVIGPFVWLFAGRPTSRPRPRQLGPDDDEDFLRGLR
jgi:hypothetical membrane protein